MRNAQDLLNQFLGQSGSANSATPEGKPDGGFNLSSMLSGPGGLATGALAGGLAGLLLSGKKPEKIAKSALQLGGVALVGGLAYKAWQNWKTNSPSPAQQTAEIAPPPPGTPFLPADPKEQETLSLVLIRAMINAAKADGHVTTAERDRISRQLQQLPLDDEHRRFIEAELSAPLDIEAIVRSVRGPEQAAEVYAASLLAIDPNGPAERGYLMMLAGRLGLDPDLVAHLHASAGVAETQKAA